MVSYVSRKISEPKISYKNSMNFYTFLIKISLNLSYEKVEPRSFLEVYHKNMTWWRYDVIKTTSRRHDVIKTSLWRYDFIMTLWFHHDVMASSLRFYVIRTLWRHGPKYFIFWILTSTSSSYPSSEFIDGDPHRS